MNTSPSSSQTAVLGGGCFWCLDAVFRGLDGVSSVESGYAGGAQPNPTYESVCGGRTGHAEVVRVTFDPAVISFRDLLTIFFTIHDPTTKDRQGNDVGTQYRSVIFAQDAAAARGRAERDRRADGARPVARRRSSPSSPARRRSTRPRRTTRTTSRSNPRQPYCQAVVAPKVAKFRKAFAERLRKTAAA